MNIHFVGCLGVSMRMLMEISKDFGHTVTGSDLNLDGHDKNNIEGKDVVVYSCAVGEDNEEVVCALQKGLRVYERAEFLGMASLSYNRVIAVAGSHGKTTVTGFLGSIFSKYNPTVHIGGTLKTKTLGGRDYLITEACEYRRSFLKLSPHTAIVLNAELDHTDYYKDEQDYLSAFLDFINNSKYAAVCGDDKGVRQIIRSLNGKNQIETFGFNRDNNYFIESYVKSGEGYRFRVFKNNRPFFEAVTIVAGKHNMLNALASAVAAFHEGVPLREIQDGIRAFCGVERRFEFLGDINGGKIYTDYAHHPKELTAAVQSARENGAKKVTLIFEPHTYTRTKSLQEDFVSALEKADRAILLPIFPAREQPIMGVTSHNLALGLMQKGKRAVYFDSYPEVNKYIKNTVSSGEYVIYCGAGTINKAAKNLLAEDFN